MPLTHPHTIIEYCTSWDSEIGKQGLALGTRVHRLSIDVADMATKTGLSMAMSIAEAAPGADLWASLPCTTVTSIQALNIAKFGMPYVRDLHMRRGYMLLMLANLSILASFVHQRGGSVSFEWPRTCKEWKLDDVIAFLKSLPFHRADFDGCCFGLQTKDGIPLKKEWTVCSTCSFLLLSLN